MKAYPEKIAIEGLEHTENNMELYTPNNVLIYQHCNGHIDKVNYFIKTSLNITNGLSASRKYTDINTTSFISHHI